MALSKESNCGRSPPSGICIGSVPVMLEGGLGGSRVARLSGIEIFEISTWALSVYDCGG